MDGKTDEYQQALSKALKWLSYRQRSQKELFLYMEGKGFSAETTEAVIDYLKHLQYINDEAFAVIWINSGLQRGNGSLRMEYELRKKGISDGIISDTIEQLCGDEVQYEAALRLVRNRNTGNYHKDRALRNKYGRFLEGKGYPIHIIYRVLGEFFDG